MQEVHSDTAYGWLCCLNLADAYTIQTTPCVFLYTQVYVVKDNDRSL